MLGKHLLLHYFIEDPSLLRDLPNGTLIPTSYRKEFNYSDSIMIRKDNVDMSVITNNTTFFTFFKGEALPKLQVDCVYFTNYSPCEFEFTIE